MEVAADSVIHTTHGILLTVSESYFQRWKWCGGLAPALHELKMRASDLSFIGILILLSCGGPDRLVLAQPLSALTAVIDPAPRPGDFRFPPPPTLGDQYIQLIQEGKYEDGAELITDVDSQSETSESFKQLMDQFSFEHSTFERIKNATSFDQLNFIHSERYDDPNFRQNPLFRLLLSKVMAGSYYYASLWYTSMPIHKLILTQEILARADPLEVVDLLRPRGRYAALLFIKDAHRCSELLCRKRLNSQEGAWVELNRMAYESEYLGASCGMAQAYINGGLINKFASSLELRGRLEAWVVSKGLSLSKKDPRDFLVQAEDQFAEAIDFARRKSINQPSIDDCGSQEFSRQLLDSLEVVKGVNNEKVHLMVGIGPKSSESSFPSGSYASGKNCDRTVYWQLKSSDFNHPNRWRKLIDSESSDKNRTRKLSIFDPDEPPLKRQVMALNFSHVPECVSPDIGGSEPEEFVNELMNYLDKQQRE